VEPQGTLGEKESRAKGETDETSLQALHQDREVLEARRLLPLQEGRQVEQAEKALEKVTS
jgi:hypothetical protein